MISVPSRSARVAVIRRAEGVPAPEVSGGFDLARLMKSASVAMPGSLRTVRTNCRKP